MARQLFKLPVMPPVFDREGKRIGRTAIFLVAREHLETFRREFFTTAFPEVVNLPIAVNPPIYVGLIAVDLGIDFSSNTVPSTHMENSAGKTTVGQIPGAYPESDYTSTPAQSPLSQPTQHFPSKVDIEKGVVFSALFQDMNTGRVEGHNITSWEAKYMVDPTVRVYNWIARDILLHSKERLEGEWVLDFFDDARRYMRKIRTGDPSGGSLDNLFSWTAWNILLRDQIEGRGKEGKCQLKGKRRDGRFQQGAIE